MLGIRDERRPTRLRYSKIIQKVVLGTVTTCTMSNLLNDLQPSSQGKGLARINLIKAMVCDLFLLSYLSRREGAVVLQPVALYRVELTGYPLLIFF